MEDKSKGVTIMITRRPKPGRKADFEAFLKGVIGDASQNPGHLGANVFTPKTEGGEYRIVFKFDSEENLQRWEASEGRKRWHAIADEVSEPPQKQVLTGLETWFEMPDQPTPGPPSKHKMAVVIWIGIFILVLGVSLALNDVLSGQPLLVRVFITTVIIVVLMTYVVMPFLTRIFHKWLFPGKTKS